MTDFNPQFDTLTEIFDHATATFPDRPLFGVKKGGTWEWSTYADFAVAVGRVRTGLASLGVSSGDRVALIANNSPEWAMVAYATYGLGASVVPMYEAQTSENWAYVTGDSGAKVAVTSTVAIATALGAHRSELPTLTHIVPIETTDGPSVSAWLADGTSNTVGAVEVEQSDVAGFVYTSGTTGSPKGVVLSHGNFAHNVSAVCEVFPLDASERTLSFLPWAHAFGQTVELHLVMSRGMSTAFAESVSKIVDNLAEVKPTILVSVPTIFTRIYDGVGREIEKQGGITEKLFNLAMSTAHKRSQLASAGKSSVLLDLRYKVLDAAVLSKVREKFGGKLKYAITGGAAIPREVAEFIDALGLTVYEGYGLSETSPIATANWPGSRRIGSVGKPIPGVQVTLDSERGLDGDSGELIIHGHNVMQGYHNRDEENAAVFTSDGGFRTGDIGRIDDDGFVSIVGRVKEQYKLANGKYVVPTPIEEKIVLSRYVANCMVYGDNRPFNIALVVADDVAVGEWATASGIDVTGMENDRVRVLIQEEIATLTSGTVKGYERIRRVLMLPEDFTTENGQLTPTLKVKRNVVISNYRDQIDDTYA